MMPTDRRLTPDVSPGTVGEQRVIAAPVVPLRPKPLGGSGIDTELVFGQRVTCFREADGWAYVQAARDGYVGWLPASALSADVTLATHKVRMLRTYVYGGPSIKTADPVLIPQGAEMVVTEIEGDFAVLAGGGYVYAAHLVPIGRRGVHWHALSLGRLHQSRAGLLGSGPCGAAHGGYSGPPRQRHAGALLSCFNTDHAGFRRSEARRCRLLEGAYRHHARCSNAAPRQRPSHAGRERTTARGGGAHPGEELRPDHDYPAISLIFLITIRCGV
jgi:hypothetical protein